MIDATKARFFWGAHEDNRWPNTVASWGVELQTIQIYTRFEVSTYLYTRLISYIVTGKERLPTNR